MRQQELLEEVDLAFKENTMRSKITLDSLKATKARLGYLVAVEPQRDLDILRINRLSEDMLYHSDIDMNTILDFNIDQHSQLIGFQNLQSKLNEALNMQLRF